MSFASTGKAPDCVSDQLEYSSCDSSSILMLIMRNVDRFLFKTCELLMRFDEVWRSQEIRFDNRTHPRWHAYQSWERLEKPVMIRSTARVILE